MVGVVRFRRTELLAIAAAVIFGVGLTILAAVSLRDLTNLWLELGKAGIQLVVVAVVGGAVAATLRGAEAARDERRRLNEYRLATLRRIVKAYNQIKAARRILRASGFRAPAKGALREDQVAEFKVQFKSLNAAQLTIETTAREITVYQDVFTCNSALASHLAIVEKYVHRILADWEKSSQYVYADADMATLNAMQHLQAFLGDADQGFELGAATPMEFLEEQIRTDLLPSADVAPSTPR
jgi:hypothetical protein